MAGRDPGGANAARPSTNDEQIGIELSHLGPGQGKSRNRLATLLHFRTKFSEHHFVKLLRPLLH
ncbi:MAG: hypothetical protein WB420_18110, partial [Bradyrhizobium sp.]